jgi:UPF0716 protein FxsA
MSLGKFILIGLLGLVVAEAGVFLLVARAIGGFTALFLLIVASCLGALLLARMGRKVAAAISLALARPAEPARPPGAGDVMTVLAALLLILPGFISDIAGLLLLLPPVQRRIAEAFPVRSATVRDDVVDLPPGEWRDVPEARIPPRREPPDT